MVHIINKDIILVVIFTKSRFTSLFKKFENFFIRIIRNEMKLKHIKSPLEIKLNLKPYIILQIKNGKIVIPSIINAIMLNFFSIIINVKSNIKSKRKRISHIKIIIK